MRIQSKVFLTILLSSAVLVVVMVQLMRWSLDQGLLDYVNQRKIRDHAPLVQKLEESYLLDQWQGLRHSPENFRQLVQQAFNNIEAKTQSREQSPNPHLNFVPPPHLGQRPYRDKGPYREHGPHPQRPPPDLHNRRRLPPPLISVVDNKGAWIAGPRLDFSGSLKLPITVDRELVGFLLLPQSENIADGFELEFKEQQQTALIAIAAIVLVLAAIFALIFAPTIVQPINQIAAMAKRLRSKQYTPALSLKQKDELGQLANDINQLAITLEKNESMRQRWLADTSHELRTPLSIIKGEIDAMLDGVRELKIDNLNSLQQEVTHLQKLIDDLSDLNSAEQGSLKYTKERIDLARLLSAKTASYSELCRKAQLRYSFECQEAHLFIDADPRRIQQLFDNLIANSCKYTDANGEVRLVIRKLDGSVVVTLDDSAPGVSAEDLPRLFDYLYRVEHSRNRSSGGTGLGLALVQKISEAHSAPIQLMQSDLGGLKIEIQFQQA